MAMWNPWPGYKYCYIHKGDFKRNVNPNDIVKIDDFYKSIQK